MNLTFYDKQYKSSLAAYQLKDVRYTTHPLSSLEQMNLSVSYHPILLVKDETVVAYFVLDKGQDKYHYTSEEKSLLLRSLSVDDAYRGQGFAKWIFKALPDFIRQHFPEIEEVVLGVNVANQPAVALYRKMDWEEKEGFYQGESGPQRIFSKRMNTL